jgi:hypothetical protein
MSIWERVKEHAAGVALWCGVAAIALAWSWPWSSAKRPATVVPEPKVPGWSEIEECLPVTSMDGLRTLDFDRKKTVEMTTRKSVDAAEGETRSGTWSYHDTSRRYTVRLNGAATDYVLVRPIGTSSVCILAKGSLAATDLRESRFAGVDTSDMSEYGEDSRYDR